MKDLITKEIEKNDKYISENGIIKFYEKSKYLSKPWNLYKSKFVDFYKVLSDTIDIPEDELITRPFRFIVNMLKNNFEHYYVNREIINKRKKVELNDGKYVYMQIRRLGDKVNHFNLRESIVKNLIDELFLLPNGFLIPLLEYFKKKYFSTDKERHDIESNWNSLNHEHSIAIRKLKKDKGKFVKLSCVKSDESFIRKFRSDVELCRRESGKINFSKLGRIKNIDHKTAKRWYYKFGKLDSLPI